MLYLIVSAVFENDEKNEIKYSRILKIGYTKDIDNRMDTYKLHNPGIKLISTRGGDSSLENYFHKYFAKYKYPDREEWFYYNQEIIDNFQTLEPSNDYDKNDEFIFKSEYINKLQKYIISHISNPDKLKINYLSNIIIKNKAKYPDQYNKDSDSIARDYIYYNIWHFCEDLGYH